ncbi:AI-2E family transporter [Pseudopedobacter beijingensis]|uniref:AI-2E family transporter n=1 Tax=Pseudopedobacter beijingensis TaxID=1207056 RepID=A0ABW4IBP3_9SPHI
MPVFTYKQRNNIVLIVILASAALILYSLKAYITAFLGAIVIYTIFKPIYLFMEKRIPAYIAATIVIVVSFIIMVIPFFALGYMVVSKVADWRSDSFQLKALLYKLDDVVGMQLNQPNLTNKYLDKLTVITQEMFPSFVGGAFDIFIGLVLMYFVLYFMFIKMDLFERTLIKYAPLKEYHARQFGIELKNATYSNILGQGLIAVVQGMLVSLAFYFVDINDAFFWGVISIFLSFMPVVGAPMVTIPAAIILYLNGETSSAVFIVLFTLIILINIDNVIRFIVSKRMGDIHPLVTIIGVLIGIPLFGFVGIVFGPLLLIWFVHLVEIYEQDRLVDKG